jgi:Dirigent-like protein
VRGRAPAGAPPNGHTTKVRRGLLVLIAVAALAAPGTAAAKKELTIRVVSVSTLLKEIDKPPKGASKGDRVVFRDTLRNAVKQFGKAKGAKVGSDRGTMTFASASSARFDGTARLPGGTVTLRGGVVPIESGGMAIPVVGGTGRYAGATGVLVVGPGSKQALNVFVLELPDSAPVA